MDLFKQIRVRISKKIKAGFIPNPYKYAKIYGSYELPESLRCLVQLGREFAYKIGEIEP